MKQKVKKALSICGVDSECSDCPYNMGVSVDCIRNLVNDISKVLQEDEKKLSEYEEKTNLLKAELTKAHEEAAKDFAHFLIDKDVEGNVSVCDLPNLVIEWGEAAERRGADNG